VLGGGVLVLHDWSRSLSPAAVAGHDAEIC
jgi:hypothetical protein